ncbi:MAG: hypothetical protein GEU99_07975 [Luteitalea sp.]|nr:hypothetical protein [Luteitalea sp.]
MVKPDIVPLGDTAHEVFAESDQVAVFRCDRGCLHFQFGPVTVTLTLEEFTEIAAVVLCAAERLHLGTAAHAAQEN